MKNNLNTYKQIHDLIRELFNEPLKDIPLHVPSFIGNEKKYLIECVDSTFVSSVGEFVNRFERMTAEYTGAQYAIATVNGTAALHISLLLAGVETGDEVVTQPLTFIATANAISYCGAQPVFLDVDMDTLGLSPISLETWLFDSTVQRFNKKSQRSECYNKTTGKRISAVLPMHTFGFPCRISEIVDICKQYNIPVVEDAAESLGSYYSGKHTGTFGLLGTLSFNGNKTITTGGGGMILTSDERLAKMAKHLTTQAKVNHPWEYVHDFVGYNYRLPNINAALGCAQMESLPYFLQKKRYLAERYRGFFDQLGHNIRFVYEAENCMANFWLNSLLLENEEERNRFLKYTNENGVMTRPAWELMTNLKMYRNLKSESLDNAQAIAKKLVNIPSSVI